MKVRGEPGKDSPLHSFTPRGRKKIISTLIYAVTGRSGYTASLWLFCIFIFIAAYAVFTRDSGPEAVRFPRYKASFLEAGRRDGRIARLKERIAADPNDIHALLESGILKFQKGPDYYSVAFADLEDARARGAADVRIFYYLGRMYQAEGLYDFALEEYRRLINNRPEDFEARMLAAKLLFASGDYPQAVREYETLGVAHPDNILVLENLALDRIARVITDNPSKLKWLVTGKMTEYQGMNYLLVERAVLKTQLQSDDSDF